MLRRISNWLLRIPVLVVCGVAVVLSALFGLVVDRAGENGVLLVPPLFGLWVVTWVLVITHAHRAVAASRKSLVQFGAPIAAALAFVVCKRTLVSSSPGAPALLHFHTSACYHDKV